MINGNVKNWLIERGFADRLTEHSETIDTVEHAAQQIGCSEAEIAKTLSFMLMVHGTYIVNQSDSRFPVLSAQ